MTLNSIADLLCRRAMITVAPLDTVAYACQKLAEHRVGMLYVVNGDRLVGVLSERDIVSRCMMQGRDAATTRVSGIMTRDPVSITLQGSLTEAQAHMLDGGFHHLPVVDHAGQPLGVLSLQDMPAGPVTPADPARAPDAASPKQ
ncbi:MAG: CBS domain-containing protein [Rhodobacteraceae bacterium]|nr:CBS domain-containing protein [Paracoccaceae bacterium]